MNISVFGLGYVGAVSIGCMAKEGHHIIGVDANPKKVEIVNKKASPVVEEFVGEFIAEGVETGHLIATLDGTKAIMESEMVFICVGTPSLPNGDLDLGYVKQVMEQIGEALKEKREFFVVVLRSTVLPGTTRNTVIPILEKTSGKKAGKDFGVCFNPEFLREGSGVKDYQNPPKIVIASTDQQSRKKLMNALSSVKAPLIEAEFEIAEMVKYVDNVWHALKVGFANEVGVISKSQGIDGQKVMDIFCKDQKLNLSEKYLKPGFAFGGSCLPKDLRALTYKSRSLDLDLPILSSVMVSNKQHIERAFQLVMGLRARKVGVLGLSFKSGTDDLRESPIVELVERLIGKGYSIKIFDPDVNVAQLLGANREYIQEHIPHFSNLLMENVHAVLDFAETVVVAKNGEWVVEALQSLSSQKYVLDFVRMNVEEKFGKNYHGICW